MYVYICMYIYVCIYIYQVGCAQHRHRARLKKHGCRTLDGTLLEPKLPQDGPKMAPRWHQDGPKMASWRVLGPLGRQDGPKMEPRGFQGRKTQFVPPMLGSKLGPHFRHFQHQGGSQEAWRPTWMTCCVQTPSFRRNVVSQSSPGTPKI